MVSTPAVVALGNGHSVMIITVRLWFFCFLVQEFYLTSETCKELNRKCAVPEEVGGD